MGKKSVLTNAAIMEIGLVTVRLLSSRENKFRLSLLDELNNELASERDGIRKEVLQMAVSIALRKM